MEYYETSPSSGQFYSVQIGKKQIKITNLNDDKIFKIPKYTKVFLGDDYDHESDKYYKFDEGNTILIHINDHKYIYVSDEIWEFYTEDKIHKFASPIGNSAVPYPYAIGERFSYFFYHQSIEKIPNKFLNIKVKNLLDEYYFNLNLSKEEQRLVNEFSIKPTIIDKNQLL